MLFKWQRPVENPGCSSGMESGTIFLNFNYTKPKYQFYT